jgi:hypothetical protein
MTGQVAGLGQGYDAIICLLYRSSDMKDLKSKLGQGSTRAQIESFNPFEQFILRALK